MTQKQDEAPLWAYAVIWITVLLALYGLFRFASDLPIAMKPETQTIQGYLSSIVDEHPRIRIIPIAGEPIEGTLSRMMAEYVCVATEQQGEQCLAIKQTAGWVLLDGGK